VGISENGEGKRQRREASLDVNEVREQRSEKKTKKVRAKKKNERLSDPRGETVHLGRVKKKKKCTLQNSYGKEKVGEKSNLLEWIGARPQLREKKGALASSGLVWPN